MPFLPLYTASIYQSAGNMLEITESIGGKSTNIITGSWSRLTTGSYAFISSGSFTGASGSITGSIGLQITLTPTSSASIPTNGIFAYTPAPGVNSQNALYVNTYSDYFSQTLADNVINSGSCTLVIGINYQ
jgi:hypothetical protein